MVVVPPGPLRPQAIARRSRPTHDRHDASPGPTSIKGSEDIIPVAPEFFENTQGLPSAVHTSIASTALKLVEITSELARNKDFTSSLFAKSQKVSPFSLASTETTHLLSGSKETSRKGIQFFSVRNPLLTKAVSTSR